MGVNPDQCRPFSTTFFSHQNLCNTFSETLLRLNIFSFLLSTFQRKETLSFLWTRMGSNYFLFVIKIFVCALCCANLWFGISISLISKNRTSSTLHCEKKNLFCQLLEETHVSQKKHYFLLLVHVFFCLIIH